MNCPWCLAYVHDEMGEVSLLESRQSGGWEARSGKCPSCDGIIVYLRTVALGCGTRDVLVWPRESARVAHPFTLPAHFARDYQEASLVLEASPRASAALGRRCLQRVLREKAGVTPGHLSAEIDEVLALGLLPPGLSSLLDAMRVLGKFATHRIKSTDCGTIAPVEPGEAEWVLDLLSALFGFYFAPAIEDQRRESDIARAA